MRVINVTVPQKVLGFGVVYLYICIVGAVKPPQNKDLPKSHSKNPQKKLYIMTIEQVLTSRRALRASRIRNQMREYKAEAIRIAGEYGAKFTETELEAAFLTDWVEPIYGIDRSPQDEDLRIILDSDYSPTPQDLTRFKAERPALSLYKAFRQVLLSPNSWYGYDGKPGASTRAKIITLLYMYGFDFDQTTEPAAPLFL